MPLHLHDTFAAIACKIDTCLVHTIHIQHRTLKITKMYFYGLIMSI